MAALVGNPCDTTTLSEIVDTIGVLANVAVILNVPTAAAVTVAITSPLLSVVCCVVVNEATLGALLLKFTSALGKALPLESSTLNVSTAVDVLPTPPVPLITMDSELGFADIN